MSDEEPEVCEDHEWEKVDDSFSHEFGTEIIIYQRCVKCGAERDLEDEQDYEPL